MNRHILADSRSLLFRRTTASDAAALFALEQRVAVPRLYEARASIAEALKEIVENALFLIDLDGAIVGSISFRQTADAFYIGNMAVDPHYRSRGIATAAMAFVFEKTPDALQWELVTHPENTRAIKLYQSFGFHVRERHADYFGDGQPRVRMVRYRTSPLTLCRPFGS